jgi:hypothetical protein
MCTCREIEPLLDTYTDGELDDPRRLRVEIHLQGCADCNRLARSREDEARLFRLGDPVPDLSAGFTGQVMSSLARSRYLVRGEGFFSLRKVLARPWLAPALAALLLLVTVSWAASRYWVPSSPGQIALKSPTGASSTASGPMSGQTGSGVHESVQAAPGIDKNLAFSAGSTPFLNLPMPNFGQPAKFGPAQAPASKGTAGGTEAAGPEGSRSIPPVPPENKVAAVGSSGTTVNSTMETQPANPAAPQPNSYQSLEQQGYTVFVPGYLPPGYSLVSSSPQPPSYAAGAVVSPGSSQGGAAPTGRDSLLFTYRDSQSGGWLTLEIQPLNSPAAGPAATGGVSAPPAVQPSSAQPAPSPVANTPGSTAVSGSTGNQPSGASQTIRQASKNGADFMLTVAGSLPVAELQKVAASLQ